MNYDWKLEVINFSQGLFQFLQLQYTHCYIDLLKVKSPFLVVLLFLARSTLESEGSVTTHAPLTEPSVYWVAFAKRRVLFSWGHPGRSADQLHQVRSSHSLHQFFHTCSYPKFFCHKIALNWLLTDWPWNDLAHDCDVSTLNFLHHYLPCNIKIYPYLKHVKIHIEILFKTCLTANSNLFFLHRHYFWNM